MTTQSNSSDEQRLLQFFRDNHNKSTAPAALSEVGIVATCEGTTFCNKTDAPDPHHICCQCECQEVTTVRIPVKNSGIPSVQEK